MNVTFNHGETVNGWKVVMVIGLSQYVLEKDGTILGCCTEAGQGRNYSKVIYSTHIDTNRTYRAMRYLIKYVSTVQGFSNQLYTKYTQENE